MTRPLILAAALLTPAPALAALSVCNDSGAQASVAIGYSDDGIWTSEGWWTVAAGDCAVMVAGDLTRRYYYWRATSDAVTFPEERYLFCVSTRVFTIEGDENCEGRGYRSEGFNEVDLGDATDYTIRLAATGAPAPVPDASAAPGTYGEPYSISGILSHCDVTDADLICEVHADGWRYQAAASGPTDFDLLESLHLSEINTTVEISGDMIGYEGTIVDVTIRQVAAGPRDPHADVRAALQGLWRDEDGLQVAVYGNLWESLFLGSAISSHAMQIGRGCRAAPDAGLTVVFREDATGDVESYLILRELSANRLVIDYAGTSLGAVYVRQE